MKNKYLNFISDEHFLSCISNLHQSYVKAKKNISKKKFFNNKIDTIKLTFDARFNDIDQEKLIDGEILRQIDKSINNSIGTFHEQILGGIKGFEIGKLSGFDIKSNDNTLFADIKNKHNTMNSSSAESLFQKLANYAKLLGHFLIIVADSEDLVMKEYADIFLPIIGDIPEEYSPLLSHLASNLYACYLAKELNRLPFMADNEEARKRSKFMTQQIKQKN